MIPKKTKRIEAEELLFEINQLRIKYKSQKYDIEKGSPYIEESINLINEFEKDVLTDFLDFLLKNDYCDTDVYNEPPTAIDQYLIFDKK